MTSLDQVHRAIPPHVGVWYVTLSLVGVRVTVHVCESSEGRVTVIAKALSHAP